MIRDAIAEALEGVPIHAVECVEAALFAMNEPGFSQEPEVVRHRRLLDRHRRLEIADAHHPFFSDEDVEELHANGMGQNLQVVGHARCLGRRHGRAKVGVAAALAGTAVRGQG